MNGRTQVAIPPGSTIGILGGGQLGRMTALSAAALGYRCHIFSPEQESPAAQVSDVATVAAYDDRNALADFAARVDVVTFEFENIPHESVRLLEGLKPVRPGWQALQVSQDRLVEKDFLQANDVPTTEYRSVSGVQELARAVGELGGEGVLKTTRFGYDGKGQVRIRPGMDLDQAWREMGGSVGILEGFVDFEREISVIVARSPDGSEAAYVPVENRHRNHILHTTIAPAEIPEALADEADTIARKVARALGIVGLLAVEMFVTKDGRVLVNELAPRPHNSGHWTMDACVTGQFEQFVRAVCGLPLGSPARRCDATMTNLLGSDVEAWPGILQEPNAKLHLYGKAEARPGRKMGHVNRLGAPPRSA